MATYFPNSFIPYPYSGIESGFDIHPYHVSNLYDELSGVEANLGLNPQFPYLTVKSKMDATITRVGTLETGYLNSSTLNVVSPLHLFNSHTVLSGDFASTAQGGFISQTDWNHFNSKAEGFLTGNLTSSTSQVINITNGNNSLVGHNASISINAASATSSGYLRKEDFILFSSGVGANPALNDFVYVAIGNGRGLLANKIRRFLSGIDSAGGSINYTDDPNYGATFRVAVPGIYEITYVDRASNGDARYGISTNGTFDENNTDIQLIDRKKKLGFVSPGTTGGVMCVAVRYFNALDYIRPHDNGHCDVGSTVTHPDDQCTFRITRIT